MATINQNYLKLKSSYLFTEIARRVKTYQEEHPDAKVIRLGIGDVTRPLPAAVVQEVKFLHADDAWSLRYFDQSDLHFLEREVFG